MTNLKIFDVFKGQRLIDAEDAIEACARPMHLSVNVLDPANGISGNIDTNPHRLNVTIAADSRITSFKVG